MPLSQSPVRIQELPSEHFLHFEPPQSTSLSEPFAISSLHVASAHCPSTQLKLWQSSSCLQLSSVWQRLGEQLSPQSVADSRPFFTPSPQPGAAQTPTWQTPEAQSFGTTQI